MKKIKKVFLMIFIFLIWIWIAFAASNINFVKSWQNWDANVSSWSSANDVFTLSWRLDLEPSSSSNYASGYRWKITWTIDSQLFWPFSILDKLKLNYNRDFDSTNDSWECWSWEVPYEIYDITWTINSTQWWNIEIENDSYFCSNQFLYLNLHSNSLWYKEIWNNWGNQWSIKDDFWKQEISISGIANLKWDLKILARWNDNINKVSVNNWNKSLIKKYINKNIFKTFQTFKNNSDISTETDDSNLNSFSKTWNENYYLYDYSWEKKDINFNWSNYINEWKYLTIWYNWTDNIWISWKQTVIVKNWNIYINSNLYNKNDNSLLVLIAKKDKNTKNGWNIYIDPDVTNIDAVLIADWSLISMEIDWFWDPVITDTNSYTNALRKQLLIYGSLLSSNVVGWDNIPYWADYYEDNSYPNLINNIYDLWNLRTFNLNYWSWTLDSNKLVPIADNSWNYKENAWAWKCRWYNWDDCDTNLRITTKLNPIVLEYNPRIKLINPFILRKN